MCRRAAIRCHPPLCGSAPLSVRAPPRPVGASAPCKFRGLARKRPPPAAPMRPPSRGASACAACGRPQTAHLGWERTRSRVLCGPLAGCGCPCHHGPERAERRTGAAISLTIPAARAFGPAAGDGGASSDSSGGTSEVSNWDSYHGGAGPRPGTPRRPGEGLPRGVPLYARAGGQAGPRQREGHGR